VLDHDGAGDAAVFETFADGKPVTKNFPRIPYDEAMRKYGSDKPDLRNPIEMQNVSEHLRGSGFKVFANMIWPMTRRCRSGRSRPRPAAARAFCDRMNAWAQARASRASAISSGARKGDKMEGAGPLAKNIGESAPRQSASSSASRTAMPASSSPATRSQVLQVRRRGAHPRRRGAEPRRPRSFRTCAGSSTSRSTNTTRKKRRSTSRTTPSPCRRAARGASTGQDPLDHQGVPVRRGLQRLRNRLGLDP
jgi:hypothetical protein